MGADLKEIYEEYAMGVFKYLFSLSHDEHLSEELTAETFYQAVRSIKKYDGSCKIFVWLCQIAKHLWYQELDKRRRRKHVPLDDDIQDAHPAIEADAVLASEKIALYQAINQLDQPMKDVVYMRLAGEFSFAEIAEVLQKNENWARITFFRAKKKIVELIARSPRTEGGSLGSNDKEV